MLNKILSNVHGHILDFILTNNPYMSSDVSKCDIDFTSDHEVLLFDIHQIQKKPVNKRYVFNYKRADHTSIKTQLCNSDLSAVISDCTDVNEAWCKWFTVVKVTITRNVPKVCVKDNHKAPWFDGEVKHLRNIKLTALRNARGNTGFQETNLTLCRGANAKVILGDEVALYGIIQSVLELY